MAATSYTYSVSGDFPNSLVNPDQLTIEVEAASLGQTLDRIAVQADVCDIWFDNALSGPDESTLDGVVAAHQGVPPEAQQGTAAAIGSTRDPLVTDDETVGVVIGSQWVNTTDNRVWVCSDPSTGAAVWNFISLEQANITTGTPEDVGTANSAGSGTDLALKNHVHNLPFATLGAVVGNGQAANKVIKTDGAGSATVEKNVAVIPRTLTVGLSGDVDYTSIKTAVDVAVTGGASTATPWIVEVYPGDYTEDPISLVSGITLIGVGNRGKPVRIIANNPNADLITMAGGNIEAVRLEGATGATYACIRCTGFGACQITTVSLTNCAIGIVVESNSNAIIYRAGTFISTTGQAVGTCIHCADSTAEIFVYESTFTILAPFLALYPGVNPIECAVRVTGGKALLTNCNIRIAYNVNTQVGILAEDGAQVRLFSSVVETCAAGVKIGASGSNTNFVIQSCDFLDNLLNGVVDSATGTIFVSAATDDIKLSATAGATFSGLTQTSSDDYTSIAGNAQYLHPTFKSTDFKLFFYDQISTGLSSGGEVTAATGLTVDVAAGRGWIHRSSEQDTWDVAWDAESSVSLTASSTNYVVYDSATDSITSILSVPSKLQIELAQVVTDGSGIRFLHDTHIDVEDQQKKLHDYLIDTRKIAWQTGLACSEGTSSRKFDISAGSWYRAYSTVSYAGGTDVTFSYFYGTDGATEVASQTQLDNTQYDNAGTLTNMTSSYYRTDTVFVTSDGRVSVIYGTEEFDSTAAALLAAKATIPTFAQATGCYVANIVVQQGAGIITDGIIDIRPDRNASVAGGGGGSGTSDHGALSGLTDDDHTQYALVGGSRAFTGNVSLGGNDITNVGDVDGVDVSGHSARHNPGGSDALSTDAPVAVLVGASVAEGAGSSYARNDHQHGVSAGTPVNVGTANAAGSSTSVARADHVHAGLTRGANDFNAFSQKSALADADRLLIEDSAASGVKKYAEVQDLPGHDVHEADDDLVGIKNIRFAGEYDNGNSGATATIDWNNGQKQKITLTANCTLSFTDPVDGVSNFLIRVLQDATGGRSVTWPASVLWPGGVAPSLSSAANARDIVSFYFDGTNWNGVANLGFA